MSDESPFHAMLGKALVDADFRARLMDPEQQADALSSIGIEPTREVLNELNQSIEALSQLSQAFGDEIAAT